MTETKAQRPNSGALCTCPRTWLGDSLGTDRECPQHGEQDAPQTLTEFLLARIAEDEVAARRLHAEDCGTPAEVVPDSMGRPVSPTCGCDWPVARVLAECEAKRQLIERVGNPNWAGFSIVALPYAGHPDYLPEWRP